MLGLSSFLADKIYLSWAYSIQKECPPSIFEPPYLGKMSFTDKFYPHPFLSTLSKNHQITLLLHAYHLFLLRFCYHLHQGIFRHCHYLLTWRWLLNTCPCLFFWPHPTIPTSLQSFFFAIPVTIDWHDLKKHPPNIKSWESMGVTISDMSVELLSMSGRVKDVTLKVLQIDISRHITEGPLKSFWHFTIINNK